MTREQQQMIDKVRFINRRWFTRGRLADNAERYMRKLEEENPALLADLAQRAYAASRKASAEHRDPKPDFYATLFSKCSREERNQYLKEHLFTRFLSTELQHRGNA